MKISIDIAKRKTNLYDLICGRKQKRKGDSVSSGIKV